MSLAYNFAGKNIRVDKTINAPLLTVCVNDCNSNHLQLLHVKNKKIGCFFTVDVCDLNASVTVQSLRVLL